MKRQILILVLASLTLMSAACSKKEANDPAAIPAGTGTTAVPTPIPGTGLPTTPGGTRGTSGTGSNGTWYWKTGGQAVMTIDNVGVFERYTGRPMNHPTEVRVNVDLKDIDPYNGGIYSGLVKVGYHDIDGAGTQQYYEGVFDSGSTVQDAKYDRFIYINNEQFFQGFFEDKAGGVILVIDKADDAGLMKGSVWFKNFDTDVCNSRYPYVCAPKPPTKCWYITLGPYQCGDFFVGDQIIMGSRPYPLNYTRLGTFVGLDYKLSFNK